jgi:mannose-6-phosphate isomerase-like protein (cupin superfamily)
MDYSRRDMGFLLSALAAAGAHADTANLPSSVLHNADIKPEAHATNDSRQFLWGRTHDGYFFDMHETSLHAGEMPHAAHSHPHEEMTMLREGTLEVEIEGKKSRIGPGDVVYVASGEHHGWRNIGTTKAVYWVIAFGRPPKA